VFQTEYLIPFWQSWFDIEWYDENSTYTEDSVFACNVLGNMSWRQYLLDKGKKVVIDNLWEIPKSCAGALVLTNRNWFWYNESYWNTFLGNHMYKPQRNPKKLALMPIGRERWFRDIVIQKLQPCLDMFVWSYKDKHLPGDADTNSNNYQRYLNPSWYDSTWLSLVVETEVLGQGFITEKTFKPVAFYHPFMVLGQVNTLRHLRQQGFETFNNLWNEQYDSIEDMHLRLENILKNLQNYQPEPYDKITLQKLDHNHRRFFDLSIVNQRMYDEIVQPIYDFANSK
jgi:hypothetical protein